MSPDDPSDREGREPPEDGPEPPDAEDRAAAGMPSAGQDEPIWDVLIPDDISELEADVLAYHRERRAEARRQRLRRLTGLERSPRGPGRNGVALPLVLGALVLAAVYTIVMMLTVSPHADTPAALPLNPAATGPPGSVDGLLPDLQVSDRLRQPAALRMYRPAVMLLVPDGCDCAESARSVATVARREGVRVALIGNRLPAGGRTLTGAGELRDLERSEPTGKLLADFTVSTTPVAVLVRSDGVVARVLRTLPSDQILATDVEALVQSRIGS